MGILDLTDLNPDDVKDPAPVAPDEEYELRILSVKQGVDKNGFDYFMPTFEVVGEASCPEFNKFFAIPSKRMEEKKFQTSVRNLRNFGRAIGVDFFGGQVDLENDLNRLTFYAILGLEENEQFGNRNYIKRFTGGN